MPTTIVSFRQRLGRRYGGYEDALFEQRMLDVIERHEPSQPLFLFWAPHSVHTPYEVPGPFMERFDFIAGEHDRLQTTRLAGCVSSQRWRCALDTPVGDTVPTADRQRCEMLVLSRLACTRVANRESVAILRRCDDELHRHVRLCPSASLRGHRCAHRTALVAGRLAM